MAGHFNAILEIAAMIGLPVPDAYREGIVANYERLLQQAALVMSAAPEDLAPDNVQAEFVP